MYVCTGHNDHIKAVSSVLQFSAWKDNFHWLVLQDCLVCPTGFSANTAFMTAVGSIGSLLAPAGRRPAPDERIAIFSDALNHASIIDGIRLVERQQQAVSFVYNHCDMSHLDLLLYVNFLFCLRSLN